MDKLPNGGLGQNTYYRSKSNITIRMLADATVKCLRFRSQAQQLRFAFFKFEL